MHEPWYSEEELNPSISQPASGREEQSQPIDTEATTSLLQRYQETYNPSFLTNKEVAELGKNAFQIDPKELSVTSLLDTYDKIANRNHWSYLAPRPWFFDPAIWTYDNSTEKLRCLACGDSKDQARTPTAAAAHEETAKHATSLCGLLMDWRSQKAFLPNPDKFHKEMKQRILHMSPQEFFLRAMDIRAWDYEEPEGDINHRIDKVISERRRSRFRRSSSKSTSKEEENKSAMEFWSCTACSKTNRTTAKGDAMSHKLTCRHMNWAPKADDLDWLGRA